MVDIKIIDDSTGEEIMPDIKESKNVPDATILPDGTMLRDQVAQMFNMRPNEITQDSRKLNTLIDYAKLKTDDHSPDGLRWAIRSLGTKLGTPPLGEKLLPYLSRYAHLYLESMELQKKMDRYIK